MYYFGSIFWRQDCLNGLLYMKNPQCRQNLCWKSILVDNRWVGVFIQYPGGTHRAQKRHEHAFVKVTVPNTLGHSSVWKTSSACSHHLSPVFSVLSRFVFETDGLEQSMEPAIWRALNIRRNLPCCLHTGRYPNFYFHCLLLFSILMFLRVGHPWVTSSCSHFRLCPLTCTGYLFRQRFMYP